MTKPNWKDPGRHAAAGALPLQSMLSRGAQFTQERRKHKHKVIEKAKVQHAVRTKQYMKLKQQLERSGEKTSRIVAGNDEDKLANDGLQDGKKTVTHVDVPRDQGEDRNREQDSASSRKKKRLPMQAEIEIGEQVRKKREEEFAKKKEEKDRIRKEMEAKMKQRKKNSKQVRKVTKRGQPVMEARIEALLQKIQKG